ncbi:chromatin-remodeling complex ATPase chain Iswi-like [Paramacrobiotus metropolitanus]|uniref:chromatin-remodeling complex ATPase chain Iswi-like n=1 Tax=Paramacrobiotus metropolitanus TaxID=2943436 RepID=UPI002445B4FD|nr:chromatin-remodeling complex ATPase chain Iswi-like [Paramacrobiotus metropolitanus]
MSTKKLRSGKKVAVDSDVEELSDGSTSSKRLTAPEVLQLAMDGLPSPPKQRRPTRSTVPKSAHEAETEVKEPAGRLRSGRTRVAKKHSLREYSSSDDTDQEEVYKPKSSRKKTIIPIAPEPKPSQTETWEVKTVHKSGKSRVEGLSEGDLKKDKKKRLEYLLKQSELFAHFMSSGGTESEKRTTRAGKDGKTAFDSQPSTDHRHAHKDDEQEKMELLTTETKAIPRFEKTPFYIKGGEMRDYQIRGLNWLIALCENSINGILADEMGLGKTLQTISLIGYMNHVRGNEHPHLIIVPKSTLSNWSKEFARWCPTISIAVLKGDPDERNEFMKASQKERTWDVLVTSYEIALREQIFIRRHLWSYLVIDEAHRIKNEQAMLSAAVRSFKSYRRLLLTGTPLQNNLHELWALLNFLLPDVFESSDDFDSWFDEQSCVTDVALVERLHCILRPFLLRRIKADVEKNLPPKTEIKLFVGLTPMQRTWYRQVLLKDITALNASHGVGAGTLQNILMHLRKVCNHPYLFEGAEPGPPYTTDRHLVDNCGKMILLHKLLPRLKNEGHRVLIFCQMTRLLDILEDYCVWSNYEYCRLDGSTAHEDREEAITEFNSPRSKKFLFLLSTRAGGLGINLTSADTVILYDSDWNPQVDLQAMDRVHRIGQTKPVTVFRLVTENTVEEQIIERAERKLHLDAMVIQSGRLVDVSKKLNKDEILKMIRFNANNIIHSDVGNITDEDIDTILTKGKAKTEEMHKKYSEQTEEGLRGLTNDFTEKPADYLYQFEGENYRNRNTTTTKTDDLDNWIALPKRERKQLYDLSGSIAGSSRDSPPYNPMKNVQKLKRPSIPRPQTYRFMDIHFAPPRLMKYLAQEQLAYKKAIGYKVDIDPELEPQLLERLLAEQAKIDNAQALTAEEEADKQQLLSDTFTQWRRSDIAYLLRGFEIYGPAQPEKIVIPDKTSEEVKAYIGVFLKNYESLPDAARIRTRIIKGIQQQEKQKRRREVIKRKIDSSDFPEEDLKIPYPNGQRHSATGLANVSNGRVAWFEQEDRFVLCAYATACERYEDECEEMYEFIRDSIRASPRFRFDYLMRAVSTERVKERLEQLLTWLVREAYPQQASQKYSFTNTAAGLLGQANRPDTQVLGNLAVASTSMPKPLPSPSKFGSILNRQGPSLSAGSGVISLASMLNASPTKSTSSQYPKTITLKSSDTKALEGGVATNVPGSAASGSKYVKVPPGTSVVIKKISPPTSSAHKADLSLFKNVQSTQKVAPGISKIPTWAQGSASKAGPSNASVKRAVETDSDTDDDEVEVVYSNVKPSAKRPNTAL